MIHIVFMSTISWWAVRDRDVLQLDMLDITFHSPPGWIEASNNSMNISEMGSMYILPAFQDGFRNHDQIMVSCLEQPPEFKSVMEFKKTPYWRYVDMLYPKEKQARDNPSIFVRFLNHDDHWYAISYVASLTKAPMDKNMERYGINQEVWDSINSIRFVSKLPDIDSSESLHTDDASN
jgi:hypothetical protein